MAEERGQEMRDVMQLWRDWLTESERQWNSLLNDAMGSESFARTIGGYLEVNAAFQRMVAEGMQRYLSFVNMPSRQDVLGLGETLRAIEERLARIEETLQLAATAIDINERTETRHERAETRVEEPARTRRPEGFPAPAIPDVWAIPEELRR